MKGEKAIRRCPSTDDYECPFSAELKKIAQRELNEDEQKRGVALRRLKEWILTNPNIKKCRMGKL